MTSNYFVPNVRKNHGIITLASSGKGSELSDDAVGLTGILYWTFDYDVFTVNDTQF